MGELIQGYQRLGRVPHFGSSAQRLEGLYRAVSNLCIWAWSREASSAWWVERGEFSREFPLLVWFNAVGFGVTAGYGCWTQLSFRNVCSCTNLQLSRAPLRP